MQTPVLIRIEKKALLIECHRCGKKWPYTGKNEYTCSCPSCRTTVTIFHRKKSKGQLSRTTDEFGDSTGSMIVDTEAIPRK